MNEIYFIKCNEFVKVGRSSNSRTRKNIIGLALPYAIELIDCIEMPTRDAAVFVEAHIQKTLKDFCLHKNGEWFFLEKNCVKTMDVAARIFKHINENCIYSERHANLVFNLRKKYKGSQLGYIKGNFPEDSPFLYDMINCGWRKPKQNFVESKGLNLIIDRICSIEGVEPWEVWKEAGQ